MDEDEELQTLAGRMQMEPSELLLSLILASLYWSYRLCRYPMAESSQQVSRQACERIMQAGHRGVRVDLPRGGYFGSAALCKAARVASGNRMLRCTPRVALDEVELSGEALSDNFLVHRPITARDA